MDLATIEPALVTWAAAVTGVEASCVVWENAPRVRPNTAIVLLSWVSIVGVGIDETAWTYEANADPLAEMKATVAGPRACVLQLAVEVIADQRPGHTARAVAETARTRMQGPTSLAALRAVKLGFAGAGLVTTADYTGDNGRKISRVVCEVRLNAESRVTDSTTSYIASVHATLDVDGLVTPTGYAPTEITAP